MSIDICTSGDGLDEKNLLRDGWDLCGTAGMKMKFAGIVGGGVCVPLHGAPL